MKLKKKIIIPIISIIIVGILIGVGILVNYRVISNSANQYFLENRVDITLDGNNVGGFESIVNSDYKIFLTGENHSTTKNNTAQLAVIKALNQGKGITNIILETGYSQGAMLNKYLDNGDTGILDNMFSQLIGTAFGNEEQYQFFKDVYNYNLTLPSNKKLHFIGIDVEFQFKGALIFLQEILLDSGVSVGDLNELDAFIELNLSSGSYTNEFIFSIVRNLSTYAINNSKTIIDLLGEKKGYDYIRILYSLIARLDYIDDFEVRENTLYINFLAAYEKYGDVGYMGQFGCAHTVLSRDKYSGISESFAEKVNKNSLFSGKVLSIKYLYKDSFYMNSSDGTAMKLDAGGSAIKSLGGTESGLNLCKLDNDGSIFTKRELIMGNGKRTTDFFQYVILIENSPACIKWSK